MFKKELMMKILLLLVGLLSSAIANPVAVGPFSDLPLELYALFSESVVVAVMLRHEGFSPIRIFFIWMVVTSLTYIFFMGVILFTLFYYLFKMGFPELIAPFVLIGLEILIIVTEAKIMQKLSLWKFLNPKQTQLKLKEVLIMSLIGNVVSIVMGFMPFVWASL